MVLRISNSISVIALLFFTFGTSNGQRKPDSPKHENHYNVAPISNEKVSLEFSDSHSQQEFTFTKIKVSNKTSEFLIFKTKESLFKFEFGEFPPNGGGMFQGTNIKIAPKTDRNVSLKLSGDSKNYHVKRLTFAPKIYSVSLDVKGIQTPEFKLPASINDFHSGPFKCSVDKIDKETKETKAVFKCIYNGSEIGIVDINQIAVRMKNGQEYANDNRDDKIALLFPGDDIKVVAIFHVPGKVEDMQFANMDIMWKNTFKESKMVPLDLKPAEFIFDQAKTDGKNK